jgi:glycosyltransferase involved in cell wall biosynthesis
MMHFRKLFERKTGMKDELQAWIIVPCFNEERRLDIGVFQEYIFSHKEVGFCFVDDGSHDGTYEIIKEAASRFPKQVTTKRLLQNSGKGEAIRTGINHVLATQKASRYLGYWDADLATPLEEIDSLLDTLGNGRPYLVASGSRITRMGASIQRTFLRYADGKLFSFLASMVLGLKFRDTQCGAKLFERTLAERVFQKPFLSSWAFDVEIFARIRSLFGKADTRKIVCEVPLYSWKEIPGSKITFSSQLKMLFDLLRIALYYRPFPREARKAGAPGSWS